jgi:transcription initiation factor TFIIIB Brf1 subunit/transcription initiation factor TFIIB
MNDVMIIMGNYECPKCHVINWVFIRNEDEYNGLQCMKCKCFINDKLKQEMIDFNEEYWKNDIGFGD